MVVQLTNRVSIGKKNALSEPGRCVLFFGMAHLNANYARTVNNLEIIAQKHEVHSVGYEGLTEHIVEFIIALQHIL